MKKLLLFCILLSGCRTQSDFEKHLLALQNPGQEICYNVVEGIAIDGRYCLTYKGPAK